MCSLRRGFVSLTFFRPASTYCLVSRISCVSREHTIPPKPADSQKHTDPHSLTIISESLNFFFTKIFGHPQKTIFSPSIVPTFGRCAVSRRPVFTGICRLVARACVPCDSPKLQWTYTTVGRVPFRRFKS